MERDTVQSLAHYWLISVQSLANQWFITG